MTSRLTNLTACTIVGLAATMAQAVPHTPLVPQQGLVVEFHTDFGNPGNGAALDAHFNSHAVTKFVAPNIDRDTGIFYPADGLANMGRDNFSARYTGLILIPDSHIGVPITFRDFTDDFTRLRIDGITLIEDNTWTNYTGTQNGGGGVATTTFTSGGWKSFEFIMAEGGGGDNARLLWNVAAGGLGPSGAFSVIPTENFVTFAMPEPATASLLALGGLGLLRRRRQA